MAAGSDPLPHYEIRIAGRLGDSWATWFDGLELRSDADGTSVLRGPVADQAALHGVLHKLRDLGLELESLRQIDPNHHTPGATS